MGSIGSWSEQTLWNWMRIRLSELPDNTRGLISRAISGAAEQPGVIKAYPGVAAPFGYLACDGAVYDVADYPLLADVLLPLAGLHGWGGNGTTTFSVPDLRGRAVFGLGIHADVDALGITEVSFAHPTGLPVADRTPQHTHRHFHYHGMEHNHAVSLTSGTDGPGKTVADDPHTHPYPGNSGTNTTGNNNNNVTVSQHGHNHNVSGNTGNTSNGGQTGDLSSGGQEFTEPPFDFPFMALLAVIKT